MNKSQVDRVNEELNEFARGGVGSGVPQTTRNISERVCRCVIAGHRKKIDWILRIPQWEKVYGRGLTELGLPQPRRGINLRAVLDSLLIEHKYQLIIWCIEQHTERFPSSIAHKMSELYGLDLFKFKDLDAFLTENEWLKFQAYVHSALTVEHVRYKRAQTVMFRRYQSFLHKLNNRLVFNVAKRQDGFQEASLGLLHAIDKVDDSSTAFSAYAKTWVTRYIRNFLMEEHFPVHVPVNLASKLLTSVGAKEMETHSAALRKQTKTAEGEAPYHELLKPRVSIEEMAENDQGGQELPDKEMCNPRERMATEDFFAEMRNLMNELTDKQREVISMRYGLNANSESHTLSGIASRVGISHQQVSMREKRALQKLENLLKPLYQEAFE